MTLLFLGPATCSQVAVHGSRDFAEPVALLRISLWRLGLEANVALSLRYLQEVQGLVILFQTISLLPVDPNLGLNFACPRF